MNVMILGRNLVEGNNGMSLIKKCRNKTQTDYDTNNSYLFLQKIKKSRLQQNLKRNVIKKSINNKENQIKLKYLSFSWLSDRIYGRSSTGGLVG